MAVFLALLALLAGPAVALTAGVVAWACARAAAPRRAANDNAPRRLPVRIHPDVPPAANEAGPLPVAANDAAG